MGNESYFVDVPITMDSIIVDSPQLTNGTFEFEDESYFSNVYVPLSSFPTPPPSASDASTRPQSPASCEGFQDPDSPLLGPSIHLSNLVPTTVSLLDPSPSLVLSLLKRAKLPTEILALAICILDSLNSRFAPIWRQSLPLSSSPQNQTSNYTFSPPPSIPPPDIDTIRPEIIILSSLSLSQKFLDDEQTPTSFWAENIAQYRWTAEQINATELAIMLNLKWRLLPLWNEERLAEALEDMELAGQQAQAMRFRQARYDVAEGRRKCENGAGGGGMGVGMGMGKGVKCGVTKLWTPIETPSSSLENARQSYSSGSDGRDIIASKTRTTTFSAAASASWEQEFLLSPRSCITVSEEPFPVYTEPALEEMEINQSASFS